MPRRKGQGHFTTIGQLSDCCRDHEHRIKELERDVIDLSLAVLEVGTKRTSPRRRTRGMKLRR